MMYSDIVVPSEGDGSTFTLVGHGYYRGTRLASFGYRLLAFLRSTRAWCTQRS